jgi:hypothetical protein
LLVTNIARLIVSGELSEHSNVTVEYYDKPKELIHGRHQVDEHLYLNVEEEMAIEN